jgi:hypothetical protein
LLQGTDPVVTSGLFRVELSQLGHVLAYAARCQACGAQLGIGIHAYFPNLVLLSGSLVAVGLLGSLLVIGLGRLLVGHGLGLQRTRGKPALELLLVLAAVQLQVYLAQEALEMVVAGQALTLGWLLSTLLWGMAGQLPLAILGAFALRWLSVRLRVAVRAVHDAWRSLAVRPPAPVAVERRTPNAVSPSPVARCGRTALAKRGPPLLLHSS